MSEAFHGHVQELSEAFQIPPRILLAVDGWVSCDASFRVVSRRFAMRYSLVFSVEALLSHRCAFPRRATLSIRCVSCAMVHCVHSVHMGAFIYPFGRLASYLHHRPFLTRYTDGVSKH